jgi:hypothetical protein
VTVRESRLLLRGRDFAWHCGITERCQQSRAGIRKTASTVHRVLHENDLHLIGWNFEVLELQALGKGVAVEACKLVKQLICELMRATAVGRECVKTPARTLGEANACRSSRIATTLLENGQKGLVCHKPVTKDTSWHSRHIVKLADGGTDAAVNLEIYHLRCPRDQQYANVKEV